MSVASVGYVLDTNVVGKWYLQRSEVYVAQTTALLRRYQAGSLQLAIPTILRYELTNVLARGVRQQRLTAADAKSALAGFLFLALPEVSVHDRMDDALELALQERCSAFDALFLIVARDLNWPLVTDDRALSERANRLGIPCQTLDTLSS